jgi:hypothetical protein
MRSAFDEFRPTMLKTAILDQHLSGHATPQ